MNTPGIYQNSIYKGFNSFNLSFADSKCNDDPEKTHLCKFWKEELNFCARNSELMTHFCPETCGFDCTASYNYFDSVFDFKK